MDYSGDFKISPHHAIQSIEGLIFLVLVSFVSTTLVVKFKIIINNVIHEIVTCIYKGPIIHSLQNFLILVIFKTIITISTESEYWHHISINMYNFQQIQKVYSWPSRFSGFQFSRNFNLFAKSVSTSTSRNMRNIDCIQTFKMWNNIICVLVKAKKKWLSTLVS